MATGILSFTTDFGTADAYVAAMKGAALRRAPGLTLVDITHQIPPQDLHRAAFVLAEAAPWFPPGTVHAVVVDPGVGTARRALVARIGDQLVVAPDNGVLTHLAARCGGCEAWALAREGLGLPRRSATFHGRDLFAPAAALLASGALRPEDCGPAIAPKRLAIPAPVIGASGASGAVIAVDHFGNLISNLRAEQLPAAGLSVDLPGGTSPRWVRTYGEAADGALVALFGGGGWLEVARVGGSAAAALGLGLGAAVALRW